MAKYLCDICNAEDGLFMVSNNDTGLTNTMGNNCFGLIGLTMFLAGDPDVIDPIMATKGYVPNKAEKDRRKTATEPDYDPTRTIGEVVETGPREGDADQGDAVTDPSTDPQGDQSTKAEGVVLCPECHVNFARSEFFEHIVTDHPTADIPRY